MKKLIVSFLCILCAFSCFVLPSKAAVKYSDVKSSDWYYGVVNKASELGFMGPIKNGSTKFEPNKNMSRGMVATVLYRMAGTPKFTNKKNFPDVASGLWYTKAIQWAATNNIINGYANGNFGPDRPVTREQLAVMLRNFAQYQGKNTKTIHRLVNFADSKSIGSYAKSALGWACDYKILDGSVYQNESYLKPTNNATRAQCAKMFVAYSQINWNYDRNSYYTSLKPILEKKMKDYTGYYWCNSVNGDGTYDGGFGGLAYAGLIDLNNDNIEEFIMIYGGEDEIERNTTTPYGTIKTVGYYQFELYQYDKKTKKAKLVESGIADWMDTQEDSSSIAFSIVANSSNKKFMTTSGITFNSSLTSASAYFNFYNYTLDNSGQASFTVDPIFYMTVNQKGQKYYKNKISLSETKFYQEAANTANKQVVLYHLMYEGKTLDEINSKMVSMTSTQAKLGCGVYTNITKKNLVESFENY